MLRVAMTRYPAVLALLAQLLGVAACGVVLWLLARLAGWGPGMLGAAWLQGAMAAALGQALGLSRWWLPINLLFMPLLACLFWQTIPPWLPLGGFLILLLLNWNAFAERVPLYLTGRATEQRLRERLAGLPEDFRFIDLGSGLAGTLVRLSRAYPQAHFVGVETAPLTFALSWLRCLGRRNCRVRFVSLWQVHLGGYDVVYCFLSPAPMPRLWMQAREEMRPGALLISNSFAVPGVEPEEVVELDDWRQSRLLLWRPAN
ncbi:class I SAM-dependent methyltransferase [Stutzerimonas tarimensis]|uniref:Class I SAM-dependent methyltransferase n=1 Tax=Stutzerimonas tarimensis TaxID=1507735 RepID=A0ABV7T5Z1_9GAMM